MPDLAPLLHPIVPMWSVRNHGKAFALKPLWKDWLFERGSLTARLSALRPSTFNVHILNEYYGRPTPIEQAELSLSVSQNVWVREVILSVGETPLVYARTAIPLSTLSGGEKRLQHLGKRSLGSYLFKQPSLKRGQLHVSHCKSNPYQLEWSRRSIFWVNNKPLMVSEAFSNRLTDFV